MKEDMLEDRIERFIRLNRDRFDGELPGEVVWEQISSNLANRGEARTRQFGWWRAAAILFFVFTIGLLLKDNFQAVDNDEIVDSQFAQTENFYVSQIVDKEQLIEVYLVNYPGLGVEFKNDLEQLDHIYLQLKEDYRVNNSDKVLDALILNLQSRVDLLNRQLIIIRSINEKNDEIDI
jgi:hypothetical protein